ncbi:MAG: bifunctional hydroxymethylpyrimidine kinase/phosphomethylpyrimidine kinase [Kiritimatiellae bacterium]|nr:bifunctional hydroxymethylpyrimidine kinase/phosphomethylpyrimidine kinase [Kiritimatiellia bacterium]
MGAQQDRILAAIARFGELRILVVGDVMLDIYDFCSSRESKPIDYEKPGKRAYKAHKSIRVLGGAGNVAANLASLGVATSLVGLTGNDENYFKLRQIADELGVHHFLVRDASRPTTTKMRLYIDGEYVLRRDEEATAEIDRETSATLLNETLRELPKLHAVVLSDYDKGVFTRDNAAEIIKECRMHEVPVIVDFKPANREYFTGCDLIAPNDAEAANLLPGFSRHAGLEQHVRALHKLLGCRSTVVTLGEQGVCGFDGTTFCLSTGKHVTPVDEVGCGDTVRAGLALAYAAGLSLADAVELANSAAAVIVQKPATARMTAQELIDFVRG